ncbi:MAG TPA: type II toxin-antitoxin system VapC family toxin [Bryobacteraceae bacterium]|nr:type II toxin-antitoxin system VapC family toxin [Bryobacteraceae bacterium]
MKVLLDTHTFLWWNEANPLLSRRAHRLISDQENALYLSVVSAWEIVLKVGAGKLKLPAAAALYIPARLAHYRFDALPLSLEHVLAAGALPPLHRDPFDRMLVGQAQVEGLPILTRDPQIRRYAVETVW